MSKKKKNKPYGVLKVRVYDDDRPGRLTMTAPDCTKRTMTLDPMLEGKFAALAVRALSENGDIPEEVRTAMKTLDVIEALGTLLNSGVADVVTKEEFDKATGNGFIAGPGGVIKA